MQWLRTTQRFICSIVAVCVVALIPETGLGQVASSNAQVAWQPDEFPIGFWGGPPVTANRIETWQTVADANFTFAGPARGYSVEENQKMLGFCQQVGIRALVVDSRVNVEMAAYEGWQNTIENVVKDYGSHPALYGYFLRDEPSCQWFDALGKMNGEFLRHDPDHLPYINLFPTYASAGQLGTPSYADHLDKFLSTMKPRVLSYDHYCLLKDGRDRTDYFENLELIREYAARYNVPPWNIILLHAHLMYRDPTEAEMRWQVYTSLAYGMKGILYYVYWTWNPAAKPDEVAIVDSEGKPTKHYPVVKQLNAEMRALGKLLLGLTSTGVFHTDQVPRGCRRAAGDLPIQLPDDQPLLIGFFKDARGVDYAMIVNRDHDKPLDIEVHVKGHVIEVVEISAQDGSERPMPITAATFKLSLEAGGGRLFRLKTHFDYPQSPKPLTEINFDFENHREGWGGLHSMSTPVVKGGILRSKITGHDPYFTRGFLRVPPDTYSKITVRMRLPKGKRGQFFWQTAAEPAFRDDKYVDFTTVGDDQFHDYQIDVGRHPKWRGQQIRAIRLDPAVGAQTIGQTVEIEFIRGEP